MREDEGILRHTCADALCRPIPGHAGYCATIYGQIIGPHGQPLELVKTYPKVRINVPGRKGRPRFPVHILVALAWHGPRPPGHDVDHGDRDTTNPAPSNLAYKPQSINRAVGSTVNGNAAKTTCLRGHSFDETNTGRDSRGHRYCRACRPIRKAARNG